MDKNDFLELFRGKTVAEAEEYLKGQELLIGGVPGTIRVVKDDGKELPTTSSPF